MVRHHQWQTRSRHVTVANSFDLLHATMISNVVKTREEIIQYADHDLGANVLRKGGETHNVCKQHRDIGVAVHNSFIEVISREFGAPKKTASI